MKQTRAIAREKRGGVAEREARRNAWMQELWMGDCAPMELAGVAVHGLGEGKVRLAFRSPRSFITAEPGPNGADRYSSWLSDFKTLVNHIQTWETKGRRFTVSFCQSEEEGQGIVQAGAPAEIPDVVEVPIDYIRCESGPAARGLVVLCVHQSEVGVETGEWRANSVNAFIGCRLDVEGSAVVGRAFVPLHSEALGRAFDAASRFTTCTKPEKLVVYGLPLCESCFEYQLPIRLSDNTAHAQPHRH